MPHHVADDEKGASVAQAYGPEPVAAHRRAGADGHEAGGRLGAGVRAARSGERAHHEGRGLVPPRAVSGGELQTAGGEPGGVGHRGGLAVAERPAGADREDGPVGEVRGRERHGQRGHRLVAVEAEGGGDRVARVQRANQDVAPRHVPRAVRRAAAGRGGDAPCARVLLPREEVDGRGVASAGPTGRQRPGRDTESGRRPRTTAAE
ncbi:hypothetical protein ABT301_35405 [Streptomyces sp. NPDC000987]|uniref:hypothetical protein n=1 Tax=Streptomyces sp. NPDC000987 TaxID=3154374 RepID=UPI00332955A2